MAAFFAALGRTVGLAHSVWETWGCDAHHVFQFTGLVRWTTAIVQTTVWSTEASSVKHLTAESYSAIYESARVFLFTDPPWWTGSMDTHHLLQLANLICSAAPIVQTAVRLAECFPVFHHATEAFGTAYGCTWK